MYGKFCSAVSLTLLLTSLFVGFLNIQQLRTIETIYGSTKGSVCLSTVPQANNNALTGSSPGISGSYYNVIFSESGLPQGTQWTVTFNDSYDLSFTSQTQSSNSNLIAFTASYGDSEPEAICQFYIHPIGGYFPLPTGMMVFSNGNWVVQPSYLTTVNRTVQGWFLWVQVGFFGNGGAGAPRCWWLRPE